MDVSAMADRFSSAMSAAPPAPSPEPAVSTPSAPETPTPSAPEPVAAPAVATPAAVEPEIQFDDDPPEINFDDEAESPVAAEPPVAPATDDTDSAELSALLKANGLPKQVEDAFMRTNRGRNLLSLYKSERKLKQAPEFDTATGENKGGLGFMPTPDQIKQFHQAHSDMQAMAQDFSVNASSFTTHWFGADAAGNFRDGADRVLASVPQVLDQAYEHAQQSGNQALKDKAVSLYRTVFSPMLQSYLDGFYARASGIPDPTQREQAINAARAIEADMFGKFRDDAKLAATTQPENPLDARQRELDERESRLSAWQTKQQSAAAKATETEIFSAIDQNLTRDVEKALSTVKAGMSERAFRAAVKDFKSEIVEAVRKNPVASREFNFKLTAARTSRGADARTAPVQIYQQNARQMIQARIRTVLQELATDATRQNGALHATAAAAAAQTAPAVNGGQAPPQSIVPTTTITRKPGEDAVDYMQRRVAARLGSPN